MSSAAIREVELSLYRYYAKEKNIRALKDNISFLDKQIEKLESEIHNFDMTIDIESSSPSFEARVQTSSDGTSYAERECIRLIDIKIRRKENLLIEKERILAEIDNIELNARNIAWKIEDFAGESKQLLEYKYNNRWGEIKIGMEMHLSQSQVNKKKHQLLQNVISWNLN